MQNPDLFLGIPLGRLLKVPPLLQPLPGLLQSHSLGQSQVLRLVRYSRAGEYYPTIGASDYSTTFLSRAKLSEASVHIPKIAGIGGSTIYGAPSIVVSGNYEDDHDEGDLMYVSVLSSDLM